ncbi:MAG TPA: hypothetical protein VHL05_12405 [Terriglobales bacterium]|jgi:hypothetical protein|nr:hypothetical protein [Terriglobales bacterium]
MYDLAVGDDEMVLGEDEMGEDEMGEDLVFGDDFEGDGFGGPRRRRRSRGHGHPQGHRQIRLARIQPTKQTQVCSFPQGPNGATTVTSLQTAVLTARPQRPFQTERLVIPSTLSPFFAIVDLVIGRDSMFVNSEAAAAEVFSQTGVKVSLMGFIARPGIDITLTVTNIDGASHPFYGSIIGPSLV